MYRLNIEMLNNIIQLSVTIDPNYKVQYVYL